MKGLISCSVACRFYDIPTGKCRLGCEEKADPNADFYDDCPLPDAAEVIRCGDCRWWEKCGYGRRQGRCALYEINSTDALWFCADGQKREDNGNENNNNND